MSVLDTIKADLFDAIDAGEKIGQDIAARVFEAAGHDAKTALGHILDMVIEHQSDLSSAIAGLGPEITKRMDLFQKAVMAALPAPAVLPAQSAPVLTTTVVPVPAYTPV
jgi:hypothetical protein